MVQSADDSEGITRVAFQEPLGALEQFVLRHHADDVAEKLGTGRTVHLLLDETVKPPELVIRYDDTESE